MKKPIIIAIVAIIVCVALLSCGYLYKMMNTPQTQETPIESNVNENESIELEYNSHGTSSIETQEITENNANQNVVDTPSDPAPAPVPEIQQENVPQDVSNNNDASSAEIYEHPVAPEYEDTAMRNKFTVPDGVDPTTLTYESITKR